MRTYTVADTDGNIIRGNGVEIMASSFEEARDKAESIGVQSSRFADAGEISFVYAISDGSEIRHLECETITEAFISIGADGQELL